MIYGESGILLLTVEIQSKALSFWFKLIENKETFKLSSQIYMATYAMHMNKQLKSDWIRNIKYLLCSLGFSGIWLDQGCGNLKWLNLALKQRLKDQYIQHWYQLSNVSTSSGNNYRLFKTTFECGQYFKLLSENLLSSISHKKPQTTCRSWPLDRNKFTRTNNIMQQRHWRRIPLFVSMQKN